jgi:DNA-binding response OmpR family regulator
MSMRFLLVEDDPRMLTLVHRAFAEDGHVVDDATTGAAALLAAAAAEFDVIVLDVMLPDLSGFEVLRRLRGRGDRTPVLMLTARDAVADVVAGLNAGADDYLTKPFSLAVLMARLRALSRHGPALQGIRLEVADLVLDPVRREAWRGEARLTLSRTEFNLLECLVRRAGRVVTRRALIDGVWGIDRPIESNTLDAYIRLLRRRLETGNRPALIQTVRGVGYRLSADAEG